MSREFEATDFTVNPVRKSIGDYFAFLSSFFFEMDSR